MTKRTRKAKRWSYSTGERGRNRVRVFEHPATGLLFLEVYEPTRVGERPRVKRIALGHRDREQAKSQAEAAAAQIRVAARTPQEHVTLATLFDIYLREVTPSKGVNKQRHDHACAELFLAAFGDVEARSLSRREWDAFVKDRRSGAIGPAGGRSCPVGARVVAYDLSWLRAVLKWATRASNRRGGVLLDRNPLEGLRLPREESPKRAVVTREQYSLLLSVAPDIAPLACLALVLAHETGHRIGAIRQLRWSDVDLEAGEARWRASTDKIGHEHKAPLSECAVAALRAAQSACPAIGDAWVFPSPSDPGQPCSRHLMRDWWERMARRANLPSGARYGWHALRRQFATELKEIPLKDLCALGGWKDPQTILRCYQMPDERTMRAALERRRSIA